MAVRIENSKSRLEKFCASKLISFPAGTFHWRGEKEAS